MEKKLTKQTLKRIEKSKLNTTVGLMTSILMGIFSFVERTIFNQYFIADYLGLYSFNYNIIYTLSYIELGLSTSVAFALYKPLEHDDRPQIVAIMRFYRKAYIFIGSFIIVAGLCLLPFLQYLVQTSVPISSVRLYFIIFLVGNASGYLLSYKNVLFTANQEDYKLTLITNTTWTFLYLAEMIIAITTRNFLYYSIAILSGQLIKNLIMRFLARKTFGFLKSKDSTKIDSHTMDMIKLNTKGMLFNRLGQVMVSATDSMLISAMVGTDVLGKYSNYQMLYSGLMSLSLLIPKSVTASLGHANITETNRTITKGFYSLNLGSYFIYSFITTMLICCANPIVITFFGADRTLGLSTIILHFTNFYLASQREVLLSYKSALGLYWADRKRPILEGLVNLIASLILGYYLGINGIIIGTMISHVCVNFIIEPLIIFHKGFNHSAYWYYISAALRSLLTSAIVALCLFITNKLAVIDRITQTLSISSLSIPLGGLIQIIINFLVCLIVSIVLFTVIFHKSESAKMILRTLLIAFSSKKKKEKLTRTEQEN